MKSLIVIACGVLLCAAAASVAGPYEVAYYPPGSPYIPGQAPTGPFPEDQGWERFQMNGGSDRSIVDGVFILTTENWEIVDQYVADVQGQLDAGPGETFYADWLLRVRPESGTGGPVQVYLSRDSEAGDIDLGFSPDRIVSFYDYNSVYIDTTVFHTYLIQSADMVDYDFFIDGVWMFAGFFDSPGILSSTVAWGDGSIGQIGACEWEFFRFGVARLEDIDTDGMIDLNDFATFAICFGASVSSSPAGCSDADGVRSDLDGSGSIDLNDFATFANAFGT